MVAPPTTAAAATRFASIRRQLEAEEGSHRRSASRAADRRAALDCGGAAAAQGTYLTSRMRMQLRMLSKEFPERELEEATCCWDSSRRLGSGRYGAVFKGELRDGPEIAIKAIDLGALVRNGERPEDCGFDREVNMLSKFRHPNLVALLGWAQQGMMHYLVYEFLPGGDLFQRLYKSRLTKNPRAFWWHERLSVCVDTAAGISHMHNSVPKGFHRDIKSANILLDLDGTAKMADFGLSWSADQEPSTAGASAVGTPGYKCPIYAECGRFNEGSEMYSFGMVVLEVLTGLSPSAHSRQKPGSIVFPIAETIAPERPHAAARCMQNLAAVAHWPQELAREIAMFALAAVECASGDGSSRPCFLEGVKMLRSMADRFPAPSGVPGATAVAPSTPKAADTGEEACRRPGQAPPVLPIGMRARARSPTLARAASPCSPPEGSGGGMTTPRTSMWPPRTPFGDSHKSALDPSKPLSTVDASKRLFMDSEASPLPGGRGDEEPCFQLELVYSQSGAAGAAARQRLVLAPCPGVSDVAPTGAVVKVALVGRHQQPDVFAAWLSSSGERKCISRRAFEVMWAPGDRRCAWLRSWSTNHILVDGVEAAQQVPVQMRPGSEITFLSEHRKLLCVRLAACGVDRQPEAEASPVGMLSPPSRRVLEVSRGGSPTFCGSPSTNPSSPAFQSAFERDMATSAPSMMSPRAGLDRLGGSTGAASPVPKALSKFTWEAVEDKTKPSENGGLASKVVLELCSALDVARGRKPRQSGPLQLSARPLLVGPRHQPEFFQGLSATLGGAARLPHLLCLAFVGEEHWVFAVVPLVLLRADSTRVELARDELAVVSPGDRILISCESTVDRSPTGLSSAEELCLRLLVA